MRKKITKLLFLAILSFTGIIVDAQNCTSLYILNAQNGNVYDISALNGTLPSPLSTFSAAANSNLAVGANPTNTSQTVFTTSNTTASSPVYVANASIGTTLPKATGGFTANPVTSSPNYGYVYGISADRHLLQASPAPASDLGIITGDALWTAGSVSNDAFFDNTGQMFVVVTSGSSKYLYKINITTRVATQFIALSGSLPTNFQGLAFHNGKIYAVEGFKGTILIFLGSTFNARVYEINPNTGVSVVKTTYTLNSQIGPFANTDDLDLASCQFFTPPDAPTCNELFGVVGGSHSMYRINLNADGTGLLSPSSTLVATGSGTSQQNGAYGPLPTDLTKNQFVTAQNANNGPIYSVLGSNSVPTFVNTGFTWNGPGPATNTSAVGIGTDPSSGTVWGLYDKSLTKWTGSGNSTVVGNITGDANWTAGISLNDIAVDNGGNLYAITSVSNTSIWLYRINPTTLVATPVVQLSGTVPNLRSTNANGLAYLGDYFYYSRVNGNGTDIWRLNALTGISTSVGTVTGTTSNKRDFGDLASCATVTKVPSNFTFNCSSTDAGLQNGYFNPNGTVQTDILRIPISGAVNGLADVLVTGSGISTSPSPYTIFVEQGATFIDVPVTYNGLGTSGNITVTVSSGSATGSCSINIPISKDTDGDGIPDYLDLDNDNDGILDADECAAVERVAGSTFAGNGSAVSTSSVIGWNLSGGVVYSPGANSYIQFVTDNSTQTLSQTVNNISWNGDAPVVNMQWNVRNADGNQGSNNVSITISYAGTVYATITTDKNNGAATMVANGGATLTGTIPTYQQGGTLPAWVTQSLTLPNSVPTSGLFEIKYVAGAGIRDDVNLNLFSIQSCVDTDGDGIPDYLDLDSDGDGCPDAIEGGGGFTTGDLFDSALPGGNSGASYNGTSTSPVIKNLGNTVGITPTTNGVPTIAGTGQTIGSSKNAAINGCPVIDPCTDPAGIDSDGDGINDVCDLDDDNDGILDTDECGGYNTVTNGDFSVGTATGWTLGDGWGANSSTGEARNTKDGVVNSMLSQTVHNLNSTYNGILTVSMKLGVQDASNAAGNTATLDLMIDGVVYATFTNGIDRTSNNITLSLAPGVTSNFVPFGTDGVTGMNYKNITFDIPYSGPATAVLAFRMNAGKDDWVVDDVVVNVCKDTDGDGIPDYLDLDSDGDGCPDAIEGGGGFTTVDLFDSALPGGNSGVGYNGTSTDPVIQNLGNTVGTTPTTNGVPTIAGTGQTIGSSKNPLVNNCAAPVCYIDPTLVGTELPVNHGITLLQRAGTDNGGWPMNRTGAHTVLESNTKGFVITRIPSSEFSNITNPIDGMMVYDMTEQCLKIYTVDEGTPSNSAWKCYKTPTCP